MSLTRRELILNTIKEKPGITGKELVALTKIPRRSLHTQVKILEQLLIIDRKPSLRDTRQYHFFLSSS